MYGDRFTPTDIVCIGSSEVQTTFISEQELLIVIPVVEGGSQSVVVHQEDGTESDGKLEELNKQLEELKNRKPKQTIIVKEVEVSKKNRR